MGPCTIMCPTNKGTQKGLVAFEFPAPQTRCSANVAKRYIPVNDLNKKYIGYLCRCSQ